MTVGAVAEYLSRGLTESEIAAHFGLTAGGRETEEKLFAEVIAGGGWQARGAERAVTELWLRQQGTIIWYYEHRLAAIGLTPRQRPRLWEQLIRESSYAYSMALRSYKPGADARQTFNRWLRGYLGHGWNKALNQECNRVDRSELDFAREHAAADDSTLSHLPTDLRAVADLLVEGHEHDEIAVALSLSPEDVSRMIQQIESIYRAA